MGRTFRFDRSSRTRGFVFVFMAILVACSFACKRNYQSGGLASRSDSARDRGTGMTPLGPVAPHSPMFTQLGVVSLSLFAHPLPGATTTSAWCVCRAIGTSPHIGIDIATRSGSMVSRAVADGEILEARFNGECGWEVLLRDPNGAKWRYRHLNKPYVETGDRVVTGRELGEHRDYPKTGCGTGEHLHLERLSASRAVPSDREKGKSCSYGYRSCNFDPGIISQMNREAKMFPPQIALTSNETETEELLEPQKQDSDLSSAFGRVEADREEAVREGCLGPKLPVPQSTPVWGRLQKPLEQLQPSALNLLVRTKRDASKGRSIVELATAWSASADRQDLCGASARANRCFAAYSIYVQTTPAPGQWFLAAEETGLATDGLAFGDESGHCFAPSITKVRVVLGSHNGREVFLGADLAQ